MYLFANSSTVDTIACKPAQPQSVAVSCDAFERPTLLFVVILVLIRHRTAYRWNEKKYMNTAGTWPATRSLLISCDKQVICSVRIVMAYRAQLIFPLSPLSLCVTPWIPCEISSLPFGYRSFGDYTRFMDAVKINAHTWLHVPLQNLVQSVRCSLQWWVLFRTT